MRIGIIGGTFNPVHFGHLNSAQELCEIFNLDKMIFIPTFITPQKDKNIIIPAELRLNMLQIACAENDKFFVSSVEIERQGVSYTFETVNRLKEEYSKADELFFVTGTDVFSEMSLWRSPDILLKACNLIVNHRSGFNVDNFMNVLDKSITSKYNINFSKFKKDTKTGLEKIDILCSNTSIYLTCTTKLSISSTQIRKSVKEKRSIKYLLPKDVLEFIYEKGLYLN